MVVVKKLGVGSFAKMQCLIGISLGLLLAVVQIITYNALVMSGSPMMSAVGAGEVYWSLILAPVIYGVLGLVLGGIIAYLYNIFAKLIGGVDVDLQVSPSMTTEATSKAGKKRK